MFENLKILYETKPKTLAFLIFLIVTFVFLHMFSVWQLDIICVGPVWSSGWCHPEGRYADDTFQCWMWRTTVGSAYDTLLFINFVSFYGTILCFIYLLHLMLATSKQVKTTPQK